MKSLYKHTSIFSASNLQTLNTNLHSQIGDRLTTKKTGLGFPYQNGSLDGSWIPSFHQLDHCMSSSLGLLQGSLWQTQKEDLFNPLFKKINYSFGMRLYTAFEPRNLGNLPTNLPPPVNQESQDISRVWGKGHGSINTDQRSVVLHHQLRLFIIS